MSVQQFIVSLILGIFSSVHLSGQNQTSRLYDEIQMAVQQGVSFQNLAIVKQESETTNRLLQQTYQNANFWQYDVSIYDRLKNESPSHLSINLMDYKGQSLTVLLERQAISGMESRLLTSKNSEEAEPLPTGYFYRGILKDQPGSMAAFSFYDDQTIAIMSTPELGNMVLGKMQAANKYTENELPHILYYENELPRNSGFHCGVPDLDYQHLLPEQQFIGPDTIYSSRCKVIKVFLECDYRLYTDYNGSTTQVRNYITGLFNVVKTLYYNEFVNIEISDIMVWTTPDPFLHSDLASIIYHYAGYRQNNFTGNLAQLVTTYPPQQQGGIAFLSTLCQPFNGQAGPHSFAFIYRNYSQLPTYSWSVEVMTHELGHNLGSPHTHACAWGPARNMALDNCQPPENNACAPGPQPIGGGTIMSYCHLTGIGINFSKGFGQEPGDLIRTVIQSRSCLSSRFVPVIESNSKGPFYEGDNIILKARPTNNAYSYDWFHYDYLLPNPKDSILRPTYSGVYRVAISDQCTEYSQSDTIEVSDFLVNLGCPVIKGFRDSVKIDLMMNADQGTSRDTLIVPDSLFQKVPSWGKDVLVELHTKITPLGTSWTRDVVIAYQAPSATSIVNTKYVPNATEPVGFNGEKTYIRKLGRFNPKGEWYFTTNDIKFDNGIDARVLFSIVISWRKLDSVPPCRIALCDGQTKTFDAGIQSAMYTWSTGENSKTIQTNKEGTLSLQVMKGARKASHTVELYTYPTQYKQMHTICSGDTVKIGKRRYTKTGIYVDSLKSITGCDSIITSTIDVLPTENTEHTITICYGEVYWGIPTFRDTQYLTLYQAMNGCDSLHTTKVKVNPPLVIQATTIPACPEIGGSIEVMASGGTGLDFIYEWADGNNTSKIDNIASGLHRIKITDSLGCSLEKDIELINLDSVSVLPLIFDVSCFGKEDGKIFIDFNSGKSPFTINWSTGSNSKDLSDLKAGIYQLFVRDANGCRIAREIEVKSPPLLFAQIETKGSTGLDGSAKALVSGGSMPYIYFWSTAESSSEIDSLSPGDYWLIVYDKNGCETRVDFTIQQVVGTNQDNQSNEVHLFPIPVKDKLIISFDKDNVFIQNATIRLFDIHSRECLSQILKPMEKIQTIDLSHLASGVYVIEIRTKENQLIRKLILKD